jgi:hypothetical protein
MNTRHARLTLLVLALVVGLTVAADAQEEWKIYLKGKVEPIVARYYAEEAPWVYYQDDESMYVFALGCNRIGRIERGGSAIPLPACPVELLPTTSPRILVAIMDLEAKRLEDGIARLREQTRAYAQAVVGTLAVTGELMGVQRTGEETQRLRSQSLDAVAFLQSQINDTLFDIRLTEQRVGALLDAAQSFPPRPRQRYFFAPR